MDKITIQQLREIKSAHLLQARAPTEITVSVGGSAPMTVALIIPGWAWHAAQRRFKNIIDDLLDSDDLSRLRGAIGGSDQHSIADDERGDKKENGGAL